MFELSGFQRDILYCIAAADDPHGREIQDRLEETTSMDVNYGRLYPNLDTLVEKGLIKKQSKDGRANLYTLSDLAINIITERRQWENSQLKSIELN